MPHKVQKSIPLEAPTMFASSGPKNPPPFAGKPVGKKPKKPGVFARGVGPQGPQGPEGVPLTPGTARAPGLAKLADGRNVFDLSQQKFDEMTAKLKSRKT